MLHIGKFYIRYLFIGVVISQIFRCSTNPEIRKSENPLFRSSGIVVVRFQKFQTFANRKLWISRLSDFQVLEKHNFQKTEHPDFRISGAPGVEFPEASDAWHRRCPDPSEKHGMEDLCNLASALMCSGQYSNQLDIYSSGIHQHQCQEWRNVGLVCLNCTHSTCLSMQTSNQKR